MRSRLELGAEVETLTPGELKDGLRSELAQHAQDMIREYARGLKYMRFGPVAAPIANNAFLLNGSSQGQVGPREGFAWSVRRITVSGLASGATPDVANLYRNGTSRPPIWQFTGNAFAQRFGKLELLLLPGEHLDLVSVGSITATGQITLDGDVLECAAEEIGKLF